MIRRSSQYFLIQLFVIQSACSLIVGQRPESSDALETAEIIEDDLAVDRPADEDPPHDDHIEDGVLQSEDVRDEDAATPDLVDEEFPIEELEETIAGEELPEETEDLAAEDTRIEEIIDIVEETGPGSCVPDDFARQLLCNPGYKCTLGSTTGCTATGICDIPGDQVENQICTEAGESDNCQTAYLCHDDGAEGRCRKFCDSNADCLGGNAGCIISVTTPTCTEGLTGVDVCTHNCDYFSQTGCQDGQACRFIVPDGESVAYSDCTAAGSGTQGANCDDGEAECTAGYDCFYIDASRYECLKICRYPSGSPSCGSGTSCAQGTGWPVGVGACI